MKAYLKKYLLNPVWDTFFPPVCFLCGSILNDDQKVICLSCLKTLPKFQKFHLSSFDKRIISHFYILYDYENSIRTLMHLYKYKRYLSLAKYFAMEAVSNFPELKKNLYNSIIPVPLHKTKYRERGYNQSALLAEQISRLTNVPLKSNLLN